MIVTEREALQKRKEQEENELETILDQNTTIESKTKESKGETVMTGEIKKKLNS